MRDHEKIVGLTAHQHNSEMLVKLSEHSYKPPQNIRKKEKLPPADFYGKVSLEILNPNKPFSLFLWFSGEGVSIVDLMIDGKKSTGWILNSGRKNGVQVTDIIFKGSIIPLGFRPRGVIQATFWRVMKMDDGWFPDEGEKAYAVMQMHYRSPETVLGLSSVLNPSSIMSSPGFKQTIRYQDFVTSDMLPSDLGLDTVMENEENQENCKLDRTVHDLAEIVESRPDPLDDVKSSLHLESSLKLVKEDELVEPSDDEEFTQPNLFRYHQDDIETMSRSGTLPNTTTPHRKRVPLTYLSSHYRITVEDDTVIDDLLPTIQKLVKRENITVFGRNCEGGEKEIQLFERLFDVVSLYVVGAHA